MRPFRDPFSLETAEGFPVDDLHHASRVHDRRGLDRQKKSDEEKNGANTSENAKRKENGI